MFNMYTLTLTNRFRAAFEFKNAKSTAAWSIEDRFVASGRRVNRVVNICEGPCGASVGVPGGVGVLGGEGTGVGTLL